MIYIFYYLTDGSVPPHTRSRDALGCLPPATLSCPNLHLCTSFHSIFIKLQTEQCSTQIFGSSSPTEDECIEAAKPYILSEYGYNITDTKYYKFTSTGPKSRPHGCFFDKTFGNLYYNRAKPFPITLCS